MPNHCQPKQEVIAPFRRLVACGKIQNGQSRVWVSPELEKTSRLGNATSCPTTERETGMKSKST